MQKKEAEWMQVLRRLKKKHTERNNRPCWLDRKKQTNRWRKNRNGVQGCSRRLRFRRCGECGQIFIVHRRCRDQQNKYWWTDAFNGRMYQRSSQSGQGTFTEYRPKKWNIHVNVSANKPSRPEWQNSTSFCAEKTTEDEVDQCFWLLRCVFDSE